MSKFLKTFTTAFVALAMVAVMAPVGSAQTADLAAQIASLLAQIQTLQAQLAAAQGTSVAASYNFAKDLTLGSKGDDVTALQTFLESKKTLTMPAGVAKGYFGNATKKALAAYQGSVGISATGYFGPKTRTYVNSLAVVAPTGTTTITTTVLPTVEGLTVAADTAVAATIGSGTAFNKALKLNFSAGSKDVKVSSITVTKSGFLANTRLNGVDVIDSKGVRHGNVVTSINADNTVLITMTTDPIVVAVGKTESATIRFNLTAGDYTGTVAFTIASVSAIKSDTATVNATFPITGNTMSVVYGGSSLASTTLGMLTTTGTSTPNIDAASAQEITRFKIKELSSNEAIKLYSMTLYNNGTAAEGDVKDVQLLDQDGSTVLATAQQIGKYVKLVLDTPKEIAKGATRDFIIKAKIVSGASRTIQFLVYESYDIDLRGVTTGVSVIPTGGGGSFTTESFPIGRSGNTATINSGTMTLVRASDSPSTAVTPGSSDIVLAKYTVKAVGENMELRKVSFYIATSTNPVVLTGSVTVEVDGSTVYSTAASNIGTGSATAITLTSYPILAAGVNSTIVVKGSVNTTATSSSSYQVKSFDITEVKRITTNDLTDPSVSAIDGNSIAVNAGALVVTTLVTPAVQSIVAGTNDFEFSTIELSAQTSGEDVKVTRVIMTQVGLPTASSTYLSGFALYKDSASSPLAVSGSPTLSSNLVTFTLASTDGTFVVSKGTKTTLHFKANISTEATTGATSTFSVVSDNVTATGVATGNTVTPSYSGSGQQMTVQTSGSLNLALLSGSGKSPSTNQVVKTGTSDQVFLSFTANALYESIKLRKLVITATSTSGAIATTTLKNIALYEGSATTPRETVTFPTCTSSGCVITFGSDTADNILSAEIPTTGTTLTIKASVNNLQASTGAKVGDVFKLVIASSTTDVVAKGKTSGQTATVSALTAPTGLTYVVPQTVKVTAYSPASAQSIGSGGSGTGVATIAAFKIENQGSYPVYATTSGGMTFSSGQSGATSTAASDGAYRLYIEDSSTVYNYFGSSTVGTTLSSSTIAFDITNISEPNRTISAGASKYLIVRTNLTSSAGSSYQPSFSALGNITFYAKESDSYLDLNADGDTSDTVYGLYVDGAPATVEKTTLN